MTKIWKLSKIYNLGFSWWTRKKICLLTLDKSHTSFASKTLFNECQKICQYLTMWWSEQFELLPQLREHIGPFIPSKPELEPLLPLFFTQPFWTKYGLDGLATVEYRLCKGQVHNALDDVFSVVVQSILLPNLARTMDLDWLQSNQFTIDCGLGLVQIT